MPTPLQRRARQLIDADPTLAERVLMLTEPIGQEVNSTLSAVQVLRPLVANQPVEHFAAMALSNNGRVLGSRVLTIGTDTSTPIDVRDLLRWALTCAGRSPRRLIVAHNHPSGNFIPSHEDYEATRALYHGCSAVGISLDDHLVFGGDDAYSMRASGDWASVVYIMPYKYITLG